VKLAAGGEMWISVATFSGARRVSYVVGVLDPLLNLKHSEVSKHRIDLLANILADALAAKQTGHQQVQY